MDILEMFGIFAGQFNCILMKHLYLVTCLVAIALPSRLQAETLLFERFYNEVSLDSSLTPEWSPPANLGTFDIVINAGTTLAANAPALAAFNRAAAQWEAFIADSITITIDADMGALGASTIGSTSSTAYVYAYDTLRDALVADAVNEADDGIVASLPTSAQFSSTLDGGIDVGGGNSVTWNGNLSATAANLKALGIVVPDVADATITFNTSFSFDFDNSDGVTTGSVDFETVAAHEIGHALGWTSNIDTIDSLMNTSTAGSVSIRTMDLFRFEDGTANDPSNAAQFTTAQRAQTPGTTMIFDEVTLSGSISGGEALLSTGRTQGDGQQASHLKDSLGLGLMDPTLADEEVVSISTTDLRVLDLIGYEILSPIPEPSASILLLSGFSLLLLQRKRS
ncbi:MAG: NF038122 family metalloprotease [Verrucomicrobiae bacterium]|nr:NF038122 family metalloprotease [Verrucomicrobiae bacterium]